MSETLLDCLTAEKRRGLNDLHAVILHAMRLADEGGTVPTLQMLSNRLGRDPEVVSRHVVELTERGLLSHSSDDPDRLSEDSVIAYECQGDLPLVG